ncbi:MAG: DUF72 domain-containing protein [Halobacteriota archaeon]
MHEFTRASRLRNQVRVGTSGWSYDDWVGPFYQSDEKPKWLDFYANVFPTVEINSTYYRIPNQKLTDIWIEKGMKHEGFEYSLKFPRFYELEDLHDLASEFENTVVSPISQNQLLGAILIQLTPYVKRIEHGYRTDNLEKLDALLAALHTDDYAYFVEFRHASWLDSARLDFEPGTKAMLERNNVTPCIVDGPSFPTVIVDSAAKTGAYVRLHGRNTEEWFKRHRGDDPDRSQRYDYSYTEQELVPWKERVTKMKTDPGGTEPVWVYFNNHPRGNAPRNALMLMQLLGIGQSAVDAEETVKRPSPTTLQDWANR